MQPMSGGMHSATLGQAHGGCGEDGVSGAGTPKICAAAVQEPSGISFFFFFLRFRFVFVGVMGGGSFKAPLGVLPFSRT